MTDSPTPEEEEGVMRWRRSVNTVADTQARIEAKLNELRRHRSDGYATTTDIIQILEMMQTERKG